VEERLSLLQGEPAVRNVEESGGFRVDGAIARADGKVGHDVRDEGETT
jgi:hypothetical protein